MGTVNVLEAVRADAGVRAVVNVTSDKCYENREWEWAVPRGRADGRPRPVLELQGRRGARHRRAYRRSFFADPAGPRLASARAGNVIGGGDWGADRLIPDVMRARAGRRAGPRSATRSAVRPWQHVLNPLQRLPRARRSALCGRTRARRGGWNFGPGRGRRAAGAAGSSSGSPSCWPGGAARGRATRARTRTRRATSKLDSSRRARGSAGRPRWDLDAGARGDRRLVRRAARRRRHARGHARPDRALRRATPARAPHDDDLPLLRARRSRPSSPTSACRRWRTPTCTPEQANAMEPFYPLRALRLRASASSCSSRSSRRRTHIFTRLRVLLVVLATLARARASATSRRWSSASASASSSQVVEIASQRRLPAAVLRASAASRCSASSRPRTSPRSRSRSGRPDARSSSSASRPRARLAERAAGRPAARQQRARARARPQRLRRRA